MNIPGLLFSRFEAVFFSGYILKRFQEMQHIDTVIKLCTFTEKNCMCRQFSICDGSPFLPICWLCWGSWIRELHPNDYTSFKKYCLHVGSVHLQKKIMK